MGRDRRLGRVDRIRRTDAGRVADLVRQQAPKPEHQTASRAVDDLVVIAEFRDPIFPGLVSTGSVGARWRLAVPRGDQRREIPRAPDPALHPRLEAVPDTGNHRVQHRGDAPPDRQWVSVSA